MKKPYLLFNLPFILKGQILMRPIGIYNFQLKTESA
jgi:hypothetical protein